MKFNINLKNFKFRTNSYNNNNKKTVVVIVITILKIIDRMI